MKVYRAVRYTYDYYEWEDTLGIGISEEALLRKLSLLRHNIFDSMDADLRDFVVTQADHAILADKEKRHCMIIEEELIE